MLGVKRERVRGVSELMFCDVNVYFLTTKGSGGRVVWGRVFGLSMSPMVASGEGMWFN